MELQTAIVMFIKSRPAISISALEREIGLPRNTLRHAIKGFRDIPQRHMMDIIAILKRYGF